MKSKSETKYVNYLIAILPLFAFFLVLFVNRHGIGISPDSVMYSSSAEYFLANGELRTILEGPDWEYLAHYPPGYSLVLALGNFFIDDIYLAASVLNGIFLSILLFIIGWFMQRRHTLTQVIIIQITVLSFCSFLRIYEMLWSEGFYMVWVVLAYFSAYEFKITRQKKWLVTCLIGIIFACFTRYVGVTVLLTVLLFNFIESKGQRNFRFYKFHFLFSITAVSLLVIWLIRNKLLLDNVANRTFSYHPVSSDVWKTMFTETARYLIPYRPLHVPSKFYLLLGVLIFLLLVSFSVYVILKNKSKLIKIFALNFFVYFLFLLFTNTFLDTTPLYWRTLMPIFLFLILGITLSLYESNHKWIKPFLMGYIAIHLVCTLNLAIDKTNGLGYSHERRQDQELVEFCQSLSNKTLFSNEPYRLYYLSKGKTLTYWPKHVESHQNKGDLFIYFSPGHGATKNYWADLNGDWDLIYKSKTAEVRKRR
ncbi:MAG: hypothetical protein ACI9XP_001250 [Lentimonas sp.]